MGFFTPSLSVAMIRVTNHLPEVRRVLRQYAIGPDWLEVTVSVQDWCHQKGVDEDNPFRAAKCFLWAEKCHIVMQDVQTDAMIQSGKQHMEYDGFEFEVRELNTDFKYLLHLVLHEAACYVLRRTDQRSRDEWAFRELHKHAAQPHYRDFPRSQALLTIRFPW